jgi:hypothetical protein
MSPGQFGFFDLDTQLDKIYQLNDFLPKLNSLVAWELFRSTLLKVREKEHSGPGGRPPFDVVLMFKILILKSCTISPTNRPNYKSVTGFPFASFWACPVFATPFPILDWHAEFGVQHASFCEFEVPEKVAEGGGGALWVRTGSGFWALLE